MSNTLTVVADLDVPFRARTRVASLSVDASVLTNVLSGRAFVKISTCQTVGVEEIPRRTRTNEAAFSVATDVLTRRRSTFAFVHIETEQSGRTCLESFVANAPVRAHGVDALAVSAQVRDGLALVHV
jgi:hypothetical protein